MPPEIKRIVFYHGIDLDGHCSGGIAKVKMPDAEIIPVNYGYKFSDELIRGANVFFLDFCLLYNEIENVSKIANSVTVIDHHKTTPADKIKENLKNVELIFDVKKAGCELTWEYFYPNSKMSRVAQLLGRYDVWDHVDPDVLPFQYGIRICDTDPKNDFNWKMVLLAGLDKNHQIMKELNLLAPDIQIEKADGFVKDTIMRGKIVLDYQTQNNALYAKNAFEITFHGYCAICINKLLGNSQLFESVYDEKKHDIMLCFGYRGDKWTISVYTTKPEIDASEICKKHGGGGHKAAAGCIFVGDIIKFFGENK